MKTKSKLAKKLNPKSIRSALKSNDSWLQEAMKKNAVLSSLILLIGVVLLLDLPVLREGFQISGNDTHFEQYQRPVPKNHQATPQCNSYQVSVGKMSAYEMYVLLVGCFVVALLVYLFFMK